MMSPSSVLCLRLLLITHLTSVTIGQYGFPAFVTEPEALAFLASGDQSSVVTAEPLDAVVNNGETGSPLGSEDASQDADPSSSNGYTFSINHQMMDHSDHNKFYEEFADPSTSPHHRHAEDTANQGHKQTSRRHKHHHHHEQQQQQRHQGQQPGEQTSDKDRKQEQDNNSPHEADNNRNHQTNDPPAPTAATTGENQGTTTKKKKNKKGQSYPRRPQFDEIIEPHILLEPHHHTHPHIEPDINPYYKNVGYEYADMGDVGYRSDNYWLIPLTIIIGIGALLLPMLSFFMTIMVSNGAISLSGRRKRSPFDAVVSHEALMHLITNLESAIVKFNGQK